MFVAKIDEFDAEVVLLHSLMSLLVNVLELTLSVELQKCLFKTPSAMFHLKCELDELILQAKILCRSV